MKKKFFIIYLLLFTAFTDWAQPVMIIRKIKQTDTILDIERLLKNNQTLANKLIVNNDKMYLEGNNIKDTLYIYIQNDSIVKSYITTLKKMDSLFISENNRLFHQGYIFNRIKPDSIHVIQNRLHIYYTAQKNSLTTIDRIVISPENTFPKNIVKYLNRKMQQHPIDANAIEKIVNLLHYSNQTQLKEPPKVLFEKNRHIIWVQTQRNKKNQIDFYIGTSYDASKEKLNFEGHLDTQIYNLFKQGEIFNLKWYKNQLYQLMDWQIAFPYIGGSNFNLSNHFISSRKDTIESQLVNQTKLGLSSLHVKWELNYTINNNNSLAKGNTFDNYIGTGFIYRFFNKNLLLEKQIQIQLNKNLKNDNTVLYTGIRYYFPIYKTTINSQLQYYLNSHNENTNYYKALPNLFRREIVENLNLFQLISLKNEWFINEKNNRLYILGDYIYYQNNQKNTYSYANFGLGIQILNKNQILTFEIIKRINASYTTDYQPVYVNIKQLIRF